MPKFRKKPVVIEAFQLSSKNHELKYFEDWCGEVGFHRWTPKDGAIAIDTLEGVMIARVGDWIIRGVQGEFYPCKPDIFAATYELADTVPACPGCAEKDEWLKRIEHLICEGQEHEHVSDALHDELHAIITTALHVSPSQAGVELEALASLRKEVDEARAEAARLMKLIREVEI